MDVRVQLAGRVRVEGDGAWIQEDQLPGRQGRLVLAYLAVNSARAVSREEIADVLWPEDLPASWSTAVRMAVSRLRACLATAGFSAQELLASAGPGSYRLSLPAGSVVDVVDAEQLCEEARMLIERGDAQLAAPLATRAAATAALPFLPQDSCEWVDSMRDHLRTVRIRALSLAADAHLAAGDASAAVAAQEEAVDLAQFDEDAHRRLMRSLVAAGSRGEAIRAFQRCRSMLNAELGIDPSSKTQELYLEILRAPLGAALDAGPGNLPAQLTDLVGRAADQDELEAMIAESRLVTLTGVGGVGKTVLALALCRRVAPAYSDGVWIVDLAAVSSDADVASATLAVIGVDPVAGLGPAESLRHQLAAKTALILLDNCEHVVRGAAGLTVDLLRSCPRVRVVATSREPLDVVGEAVWRVEPLELPADDGELAAVSRSEAVRLFVRRAAAVRPGFTCTGRNARTVAAICRQLDGLPLALELAAARLRSVTLEEVHLRLDADRFQFLATASRRGTGRHEAIEATIALSEELLEPIESALLRRLSVFAGGFDIDAAAEVCSDESVTASLVPDLIGRLVDRSLVSLDDRSGHARYRLLESIREYCLARLDPEELRAVRDRHLAWAARLVRAAESMIGWGPAVAERRVELEWANVRAAVEWSVADGDAELGLEIAARVPDRMQADEQLSWLERLLDSAPAAPGLHARALYQAGMDAFRVGRWSYGRRVLERCIALARGEGDESTATWAFVYVGGCAWGEGDLTSAGRLIPEALAEARRLGEGPLVGRASAMASWWFVATDAARAAALADEGLAAVGADGDAFTRTHLLEVRGHASTLLGERRAARDRLAHALQAFAASGDDACLAHCLETTAVELAMRGEPTQAGTALRAAAAARTSRGEVPRPWEGSARSRAIELISAELGSDVLTNHIETPGTAEVVDTLIRALAS